MIESKILSHVLGTEIFIRIQIDIKKTQLTGNFFEQYKNIIIYGIIRLNYNYHNYIYVSNYNTYNCILL